MRFELVTRDFRYAVRAVIAGKLFSFAAITCLALAIATNTTMFSVFDAMFLRPLPFKDADRLVSITGRHPETGRRMTLSADDVRELAQSSRSLESVAEYGSRTITLTDSGPPERIATQFVTPNLFPLLGMSPVRGRGFEAADDLVSAPGVALISDSLWHRRYQADAAAIGRSVRLDNVPYTIVGVMPPGFRFPTRTELWIPMTSALGASGLATRSVSVAGRVMAAASVEGVNAELGARVLPASGSRGMRAGFARPFRTAAIGGEERLVISALMGATAVLLVLACVNLANLMLARGTSRRREIAIRSSLGASRRRIVAQLLSESVLLSATAGAVALPLAWYGIRWIHDAVPPSEPLGPYYTDWALDGRAFLYSAAIALGTGVAFGLAPAFSAGRQPANPLRESAGAASGRVQRRVHSMLIVAQVGLALVLLAGASLFVHTYARLRAVTLGYDTTRLMTLRFYFAGTAYDAPAARARVIDDIARNLEAVPGAAAATVTDLVPLDDQGGSDSPAEIEGQPFDESRAPAVHYAGVAGRWPETFDVRLLEGRSFLPHELTTDAPVALVNATLAATFWPGQHPLGRRFRIAEDEAAVWFSVIGVVPDIRTVKLDESRATPPTAYVPHRFISTRNYGIVVRTRGTPQSVTSDVAAAVHAVDPSLALFDVYPMEQVRWLSYWMYVMWGTLFAVFGLIAIVIAAIGVFGVVHYSVARRTREIGLRIALGAQRSQVVIPIVREVALLLAGAVAIGLAGALMVTPLVRSLLLGVTPTDPLALATVSLTLVGVALVATWLPAWRASAVDPVVALRDE